MMFAECRSVDLVELFKEVNDRGKVCKTVSKQNRNAGKTSQDDILGEINEMIIAYNIPDDPTPGGGSNPDATEIVICNTVVYKIYEA